MAYVLLDTDGVVVDYEGVLRRGIRGLMDDFIAIGWEIRMWSGNGRDHAAEVANKYHLLCTDFATKPAYPMTKESVLAVMGSEPVLQFDDDPTERVGDWPFVLIQCDGKMPGRTKK